MQTRWLSRVIGLVIILGALGAAAVLFTVAFTQADLNSPTPVEERFGDFTFLVVDFRPSAREFWSAVAVAVLAVALVAALERVATQRSQGSLDAHVTPLSPRVVRQRLGAGSAAAPIVTVLIPAHDEALALPTTLPSLLRQSRKPDRVIVVADNCTDDTVAIARQHGVEAFETVGNTKRKAGALNQALAHLLPQMDDDDVIMVMDADTALDDGFIQAAVERFQADPTLMAVGGLFSGEPGHGILGQFQRNEYTRYSRMVNRRRGRVFVLTGTSSLFRATALREVAAQRDRTIPGVHGDVYDTVALTEDNELTIALKSLGASMVSPPGCRVITELMPTWRNLWNQRMRWQRGAVENIGAYGLTPATVRYWGQQMGIGYSVIAFYSFIFLILITVVSIDRWVWYPFWLWVGAVFVLEQVVTVWRAGWRARILAVLLFPELLYSMFIQLVFVKGLVDITLRRRAGWGHVRRTGAMANGAAD